LLRQHLLSISVRTVVWALIATILIGPSFAQAQSWETDFGLYLVGSGNAAELMNALSFTDLPSGPEAGSIVRLAAQGVLRGDGNGHFRPGAAVTKEQAMVALVRLLGWENQALQAATERNRGAAGVSDWAAGFVSVAMARGITGNSGNGRSDLAAASSPWDAPATRQEVAAWCVRALQITTGITRADGSMGLMAYSDADEISPELRTLIQRALELGIIKPVDSGRLAPGRVVTRAQLAQMLDRLVRMLPPSISVTWEVATLKEWILENEEIAGQPAKSALWTMVRPGGSKTALKLSSNYRDEPLGQAVVYSGGRLSYGDVLQPGDTIRYLIQGEQTVPFIEVLPAGPVTVHGQIEQIDMSTKRLIVRDTAQVVHHLFFAPITNVTVAGSPAFASDLASGLEVTVTVLDGTALEVAAGTAVDYYEADPPQLQVSGRVRSVQPRSLVVVLSDGSTAKYELNTGTQVTVGGVMSTAEAIQPGDLVQVYLSSPTSTWAEKIAVAGKAGRAAELVRGRLGNFSPRGDSIVLTDVQLLNSGLWETSVATIDLPLQPGADIWHENNQIDIAAAAQLKGAEVYAAVSSGFGRPEALRAVIWQGREKSYEGAIDKVNPGLGLVTLSSAEFILSPGAIVLKDGRLADLHGLEEGDSVQALTRRSGKSSLGLAVSVLGEEREHFPSLTVYRGLVDEVGQTAFTLTSYQTFSDGTWSSRRRRGEEDLGLGRDTVILSLLDEEPRKLTLDQFRHGFWQDIYEDAEVLAISEDGDALGLALWPAKDLDATRLSRGQVATVTETDQLILGLRNLSDFSPAKETWDYADGKAELSAGQALVIKNGRAYTGKEITAGDDILFLRRGQTVLLAWVKE
jgi:hypothetical protein